MEKVRVGVIGAGIRGWGEAEFFATGKIKRAELAALCDIDPKVRAKAEEAWGVKTYADSAELIRSGDVDAVFIATPHYGHTTIGIDALQNGLHVLVEKPLSVHKADAERLIAAHTDKSLVFAAMFNQRTDPNYTRVKKLIEDGELGEITRTNWIITNWFRTEAYYRHGGWRATWKGEGGGVLLNQCPHNLDLFQWLCGKPSRIQANCYLGKYHDIEVEDEVTAFFEYPNGATGIFVTTTGEAPGTNRLEIVGTRGKVVSENGKTTFTRNEIPSDEYSRTTDEKFGHIDIWNCDIPTSGHGGQHVEITQNFVDAILDGVPLIAPAEEGLSAVEMACAMIMSSFEKRPIDLPLDGAAYEAMLKNLIAKSDR